MTANANFPENKLLMSTDEKPVVEYGKLQSNLKVVLKGQNAKLCVKKERKTNRSCYLN